MTCPRDTNGDGNCGQPGCFDCGSPEAREFGQKMDRRDRAAEVLATHRPDRAGVYCANYGKDCRFGIREILSAPQQRLKFAEHQAEMLERAGLL